jgi:hypothetical protein
MALLTCSPLAPALLIVCVALASASSCRRQQPASEHASGTVQHGRTLTKEASGEPTVATSADRTPPASDSAATPTPADMRRVPKQRFFAGIEPGSHGMEPGRETLAGPIFIDTYC